MLATVLLSLALVATPTEAQTATQPDQKPPYTLDGVRRAGRPAEKPAGTDSADPVEPAKPVTRSAAQQKIDIATWSPEPTIRLPQSEQLVTTSLAPVGPAWHQQFIAMTVPAYYGSPFDAMGNAERAQAVATSVAFAAAFEGATRLVKAAVRGYRNRKLDSLRREIDEETAIVERRHRDYLAEKNRGKTRK